MAQHKSAKTRIRRNARRTEINTSRVSRMRSFVRKVEQAISSGQVAEATAAFREATPELHRAINKGILHRNTVQRKLSRLSARIKALEVSAK